MILGVFVLALPTVSSAQEPSTKFYQSLSNALDTVLDKGIAKGYPGISILVYNKGWSITKTKGYASLETQTLLKSDDVFRIASITKWFTAVLIHELIDEGKITLNTKVIEILPRSITDGIPNIEKVTVRHLYSHSSGIYSFTDRSDFGDYQNRDDETHYRAWTPEEHLQFVKSGVHPSNFEPGTDTSYSNTGYVLLGYLIEAIEKRPYHEVLRDKITTPLGMEHTYLEGYEKARRRAVDNYHIPDENFGRYMVNSRYAPVKGTSYLNLSRGRALNAFAYSTGAISSSTDDLLKFAKAILSNDISIPDDWRDSMSNGRTIGHAGGDWGVSADLIISKKLETIAITLSNSRFLDYQAFHMSDAAVEIIRQMTK